MSRRTKKKPQGHERWPIWLRRLLALLAVLGGAVLIGYCGGTAAYLLFWATLMPPLVAFVWWLATKWRFHAAVRTDAPTALRGERPACTLTLFNDSPLPLSGISVRMGGQRIRFDGAETLRLSLAPGEVHKLQFKPLCLHCGKTELGAVELRLQDPFGLTERRLTVMEPLRIEPRMLRLPRLVITQPMEREQRVNAQMYLGDRTPNGELRSYQPGDDVRRVNWKVSALQGRPILRATEPESRDELVLLPDLRDALPAGDAGYLAEDSIREGSLALADWFLRRGVPLRVLPDERRGAITVHTGEDLMRLRVLMSGDCFTGSRRPDEMMERDLATGRWGRRYILLTWEVDEALLRRASHCIELGAEVTLLCIGGGEELRSQAATVQRLEFHQINARRDVIAVLSGGEEGAV